MAIIKCKMCGGDLNIEAGMTVAECEYCGTRQTVPMADNEKKLTLFARANRLRAACEFDKAAAVYESIVAEFPTEAEAYWGLVLCRYGIEYVDDPATGKKIPTCHRSSFESILEDPDFEQAQENADAVSRKVYREEAKAIEDIRRRIVELSGKEQPYDVFICYKETDENGERTPDSVMAQEVYDALTEKGYRVFFSRITLEDKLGTEYEPYIFAALNSAKVMLVFGTDYEYFNAVWVKNEWSRFLALIASGQKKHLIPCYKGVDAYDMPKEFAHLQGQDMGKLGAVQDLVRGVEKLLGKGAAQSVQPAQQVVVQAAGGTADTLIARGNMALEDGEWQKANDFFEQALNIDPTSAEAYLGIAMGKVQACSREEYHQKLVSLRYGPDKSLARARQFAQGELKNWLETLQEHLDIQRARLRFILFLKEELRHRYKETRKKIRPASVLIGAGDGHTVGLRSDGTVLAVGSNISGQCAVEGWTGIMSVCAGNRHTVGLKSDGTVLAVGSNVMGQSDAEEWRNIVAVSAGDAHTVGLKSNGAVMAVGYNKYGECDIKGWRSIVAVSAGSHHTVGLKSDGTVLAVGDHANDRCSVKGWTDIVAVSAGQDHTVGLKSDGTVVATGSNINGRCDVEGWTDIVAVSAGRNHTVGLKSDGTVVAVGYNNDGRCNVEGWTDIVAVSAGSRHTVGLKSDGTVVAVGENGDGKCDVEGWKLFKSLDTLEEERRRAEEKRLAREEEERQRAEEERRVRKEEERRRAEEERRAREEEERRRAEEERHRLEEARQQRLSALADEEVRLQNELSSLRGLFTGKRRREIEQRLDDIRTEKMNLTKR